jgi:hypothetical protein
MPLVRMLATPRTANEPVIGRGTDEDVPLIAPRSTPRILHHPVKVTQIIVVIAHDHDRVAEGGVPWPMTDVAADLFTRD